jgi:hypothetical protein
VLPAAGRWEHKDTSAGGGGGAVGDGPTMVAEDDVIFLPTECKPHGTSVEHPQNYIQKVLTWPSSFSSPLHPSRLRRHPLGR